MDNRLPQASFSQRLLTYLICALVAWQPLLPTLAAEIAPAGTHTQLDKAANGVPVINIAPPNQAGISHNQYQTYNVGPEGLILNNATGQLTQTQLGGLIQNNPNLKAGQEAHAIINEVTGANRSQLQGYTEVAGKAANVMVANPYGITCNGCGFINTPNVTLTTGKPTFDAQGNLQSLEVSKGSITVEGQGLNGSQSDALSIIARATDVNAAIHAKDLKVIAGANRVAADGSLTPITGDGAAPSVSVDTGALGGMYANRIHLVSSEKGVGVNLGNLNARQGDITLNANGKLVVNTSLASGALTAKGERVELHGDNKASGTITIGGQTGVSVQGGALVSDGNMALTSDGTLQLSHAALTAGQDIQLSGRDLTQDSASRADAARDIHLAAGGNALTQGNLNAGQTLTLTGGTLNNSGTLLAGGQVQSSMNALTNSGTLQSGQGMVLNGASVVNSGTLQSGDTLALTADTLSQNGTLSAQGAGTLTLRDALRNSGKLLSDSRLTLNAGTLEQNGTLSGAQGLAMSSDTLTGGEGSVTRSQGALTLKANRAVLNGDVSAGGDLVLQGNQLTSGKTAQVQSQGDLTIAAQQATLDGTHAAKGTLSMSAEQLHHGGKSSAAAVRITAPEMENSGTLTAPDLRVTSHALTNSGLLQGEQSLHLLATQLDNLAGGTIHTAGDLTLAIPVLNNDGLITGESALALSGDRLTNRGEINAVTLTAATLALFNEAPGLLLAKDRLTFSGDALDNAGQLAAETLAVTHGTLTNRGTLQGNSSLAVAADAVTNQGALLSGGTLTLDAGTLDNAGDLQSTDMLLTLANSLTNQSNGNLLATGHLTLHAPLLENAGQIAADTLTTQAETLTNLGRLQGTTAFTQRGTTLDNQQAGVLVSNGTLDLRQTRLTNAGLLQGGTLNLATGEWINSGNALSEQDGQVTVEHRLENSGKILGQQGITLQAEQIDNRGWLMAKVAALQGDLINSGLIQGSDSVQVQGGALGNSGQLLSGDALTIDGDTLANQGALQGRTVKVQARNWQNSGSALAENAFSAVLTGDLTNSGSLLGQQDVDLSAAGINNSGTLAASQLSLDAPSLINSGLLQGNRSLSLTTAQLSNTAQGQLLSGGGLSLSPDRLENAGLVQANEGFTFNGQSLINQGRIAANSLTLAAADTLDNQSGGQLVAQEGAALQAATLNNSGTVAARTLTLTGSTLRNNGTAQGEQRLDLTASTLENYGQLLSGGDLTLQGGSAQNSGTLQGQQLIYTLSQLDNSGSLNGVNGLNGSVTGDLINHGQLWSGGDGWLSGGRLLNSGTVAARTLTLHANELTNDGLWQGSDGLAVTGDSITLGQPGRALSGGDLTLTAGQLITHGTLQGQDADVTADAWQHDGSLLATSALTAAVTGTLQNGGQLLSKAGAQVTARTLSNQGSLLSEGDLTLDGTTLNNSGAVQGNTLTIHPTQVTNQGTLTGLHALTIGTPPPAFARMLRVMAVASAAPSLLNSGALLTQGALTINGGNGRITNSGSLQGQSITLQAGDLIQNGTIQSADALALVLANTLAAGANSKISANGQAALQALTLSNQGQWIAKNLSLKGGSLDNNGAISGVEGLAVNLTGNLTQQQDNTLLSGGALTLNAASVNNQGRMQGNSLSLTGGALTNSGRLQGDNGMTLTLSGDLTNTAAGSLLSGQDLSFTTPNLINQGLIQGSGTSTLTATQTARNEGRLLGGGQLTLNTPQLTNSGWLQAAQLNVNAASTGNTGTLLAEQQGTLTGRALTNQGRVQGANLTVNYQQLTNSGTLLGGSQLNITADQASQQGSGRLFSGGNLVLNSTGLDSTGQLVALGNLTLTLANAFTAQGTVAAGNTLTASSNGDLVNQGVMQGQALNLSAGGALVNNGQLTTGSGTSNLSGGRIDLNGAGSLQGGGDVTLASRSDINVAGFTGTLGSLTLSAPGSILNSALIYAGNNLWLLANSIQNQRGDMLAGNSLWMQRDSAGNANSEVINTSGTIETQNGDITVKTGHLLNQRDGFSASEQVISTDKPAWAGDAVVAIPLSWFAPGEYASHTREGQCIHGHGDDICSTVTYYAPTEKAAVQKVAVQSSAITVNPGGNQARIAAGRNVTGQAGTLENMASALLAGGDMALSGDTLSNRSWTEGTTTEYLTYRYTGGSSSSSMSYKLDGAPTYETDGSGNVYRAVIQAGGNLSASFSNNISNTETNANAGGVDHTLTAPALSRLATPGIAAAQQKQALANSAQVAVGSLQWQDQLQAALQQINGGSALDNTTASVTALKNYTTQPQAGAGLGQAAVLNSTQVNGTGLSATQGSALHTYQGKAVDTSAYPLPSGQNGYFVASADPQSPYLITLNPKLNGLGQLDASLFGDLYTLLGKQPGQAPQETRSQYTDETQFIGSAYLLDRLSLKPEYDYRFLGDAAFDTRYVSNTVLNQTGNRYLNGLGSDLEQMRYLMDNAAAAQQSLGLQFGVSLTAAQVAALDTSIIWWEATTVNGQTVMVPKVYLSPKDVTVNNGSVIAGNNVTLKAGTITNSGSSLLAQSGMALDSQNSISNLNDGLMSAGSSLQLSALGDINNVGATIRGTTVALESVGGSINNLTTADTQTFNATSKGGAAMSFTQTAPGSTGSITALDTLSLQAGKNITVTGAALSSGGDMLMNAWGDIAVTANQLTNGSSQSGFKNGWQNAANTGTRTVSNQADSVSAGGNLTMQAGHDLTVTAGAVNAGGNAALAAGNDLTLNSAATSQQDSKGKRESHTTGVDRTTVSSGGDLTLTAGRDLTSHAAGLAAEGDAALNAGRDLTLQAEATTSGNRYKSGSNSEINETVRQQATEIASGGSTTLAAGRDVNSAATQVTAQQDVSVTAGRDVTLTTATDSDYHYKEETKTKKGFLSKKTTHTIEEESATTEQGTLLSGNHVTVSAGNNLLVQGSQVVGDSNVTLNAGNQVDILAATNTDSAWHFSETKKSGLMGTGGIGFSIGSSKTVHDLKEKGTTQSQSVSTVGSTGGNVSITAGGQAHINGADLVAGRDLSITGDSVTITPGHDKRVSDEKFEQKTSGLTLALSGTVGSAVNSAVTTAQAATKQGDSRLAALQGVQSVLSGVQAEQASRLAQAKGEQGTVGVALSLGSQSSTSSSHSERDTTTGSTLSAGRNLAVTATGRGTSAQSGDITLVGTQAKAGQDITLDAQRDILLSAGLDTQLTTGKNQSKGGSVGVSIMTGSGFSISASANSAHGNEKGNGTTWNETTLDAGQQVTLNSGRDTALHGAQVNGEQISANVGRDLTLSSLQDSDNYTSTQQSAGVGGSYGFGNPESTSVSFSYNRDKLRSTYDSVQQQTGLYAGDKGFDLTVGNHTQLDGAVISSTADAAANRLDTGTLGFSNLDNRADYKTEHQGVSFSSSGSIGGMFLGNAASTVLAGAGGSGHAEGVTQAAVSDGTLVIRNPGAQQQAVSDLSRDVEHANGSIDPIFNKEKEQRRLQTAQLVGDIAAQAMDIATTEGKIAAAKAQKDPTAVAAAKAALAAKGNAKPTPEQIAKQVEATAMAPYGTGSALQQGMQAATAVIQGLIGGDVKAAIAGGAAPYIAELIHQQTTDPVTNEVNTAANLMAHAVVNAALAAAQNKNALVAAGGAVAGEATGMIAGSLYNKKPGELSEEEKKTVSALATLASGLAGGLIGDRGADALTAAQVGKNAVENNHYLSVIAQGGKLAIEGCTKVAACRNKLIESGLGALIGATAATSAVEQLSSAQKTNVMLASMSGNPALVDNLSPAERKAYDELQGQKGLITVFPVPEKDPTTGILVNPKQEQNKGITLTTPDKSGQQSATNTGNTEGMPETAGNTTVTPIADEPDQDELAYLANGHTLGANGKISGPKVPPKLEPFTNPAQGPVIPSDWISRPGRTEGSTIYFPPGTDPSKPNSTYIRVMPSGATPVPGLENGYWISVKNGQPINPATGGTGTRGETHIPLPENTIPPKR